LIGMVPVVVLSPEDQKLTYEGPAERRTFIDGFVSQISPAYLRDLISYNRIRKQRNRLLQEFSGPVSALLPLLEPWNSQLVRTGSRIVAKRTGVIENFRNYFDRQFKSLNGIGLKPDMNYQTFCTPDENVEAVISAYEQELKENVFREVEREQTLIGPHRDEVVFYLDGMKLRNYGSQGQHRLFSVALKLAQLFYYSDELDDLPVMLLDDVFGNLDKNKTEILLDTLQKHPGQTFITSASEWPFKEMDWTGQHGNTWFRVKDGIINRQN
ncbi:MAG: DNA replication and repair protein RecF, partial [Balneolaceae bacterium]